MDTGNRNRQDTGGKMPEREMSDRDREMSGQNREMSEKEILDAAREWLAGDASGAGRVEGIAIPSLSSASALNAQSSRAGAIRHTPMRGIASARRRFAFRTLATAAIFAIGFFSGSLWKNDVAPASKGARNPGATLPQQVPGQNRVAESSSRQPAVSQSGLPSPAPSPVQSPAEIRDKDKSLTPEVRPVPANQSEPKSQRKVAEAGSSGEVAPSQYVTDEKGRIVIETTLSQSGARAVCGGRRQFPPCAERWGVMEAEGGVPPPNRGQDAPLP